MENPKAIFSDLRTSVHNAKTRKLLNMIERRARVFRDSYNSSLYRWSVRKQANSEYKKTIDLIKVKYKKLE